MESKDQDRTIRLSSSEQVEAATFKPQKSTSVVYRPLPQNADYETLEGIREKLIAALNVVTHEMIFPEEKEVLDKYITAITARLREVCSRLSDAYEEKARRDAEAETSRDFVDDEDPD